MMREGTVVKAGFLRLLQYDAGDDFAAIGALEKEIETVRAETEQEAAAFEREHLRLLEEIRAVKTELAELDGLEQGVKQWLGI
jgi:flagellar motility protein MotE (MotC chaperone)